MNIVEFARQLGIDTVTEFNPNILVPEAKIRMFCKQNKCGNYNNHYMCPPLIGTISDINKRLRKYRFGLLLQYKKFLDVKNDIEGVNKSKIEFHKKILLIEDFMQKDNINEIWSLIGGSCALCKVCLAKFNQPCLYPTQARTSLEATAINVMELLDKLGLDNKFYEDTIIWTGCVLFNLE